MAPQNPLSELGPPQILTRRRQPLSPGYLNLLRKAGDRCVTARILESRLARARTLLLIGREDLRNARRCDGASEFELIVGPTLNSVLKRPAGRPEARTSRPVPAPDKITL